MPRIHLPDERTMSRTAIAERVAPFGARAALQARRVIARCPHYSATPVRRLSGPARTWGLRQIWVKDERTRLGLRSFKALGGAYAVLTLSRSIAAVRSIGELFERPHPALAATTFAAATSGNHGCSVAAGAKLVGARCVVFVKHGVPAPQLRAISDFGARIVAVPGSYDDAVDACRRACAANGFICVPDSTADAHDAVVTRVMQGYTLIAAELAEQLPRPPSHVVLQAGVGGLAAAVAGHLVAIGGTAAPRVIVVEPDVAACLLASAVAGRPVSLSQRRQTTMGRLDCYAPSHVAWSVLEPITAAYVSVADADADAACRLLDAHNLHTTPSGAAGLAGLAQLAGSPDARSRLALTPDSEVVVLVTEAPVSDAAVADRNPTPQ